MKGRWRPTPATVIACVALFVALGGGAYAAGLITSQDVKNNSLRGIDVKNNSLSARDINEATLPGLPRLVKPFDLTNGQKKVMVSSGPLKLTARCDINVGGNDTARILISTTQNNSSFDAWDETETSTPIRRQLNTTRCQRERGHGNDRRGGERRRRRRHRTERQDDPSRQRVFGCERTICRPRYLQLQRLVRRRLTVPVRRRAIPTSQGVRPRTTAGPSPCRSAASGASSVPGSITGRAESSSRSRGELLLASHSGLVLPLRGCDFSRCTSSSSFSRACQAASRTASRRACSSSLREA